MPNFSSYHDKRPEILRYLHGDMNPSEKTSFETEMQQNDDLRKEVEFDSLLLHTLEKDKHETFKALLSQKVAEEGMAPIRTFTPWQPKYYSLIAAAAIILIVFAVVFWNTREEKKPEIVKNTTKDSTSLAEKDTISVRTPTKTPINRQNSPNSTKTIVAHESKKSSPKVQKSPVFDAKNYEVRTPFVAPILNPPVKSSDEVDIIGKSDSLIQKGNYPAALQLLNSSEDKSTDVRIWYLLGECYYYTKDYTQAALYFRKVAPLGGRNAGRSRWYITLIYMQNQQKELATKQLDTVLMFRNVLDAGYLQQAEALQREIH